MRLAKGHYETELSHFQGLAWCKQAMPFVIARGLSHTSDCPIIGLKWDSLSKQLTFDNLLIASEWLN